MSDRKAPGKNGAPDDGDRDKARPSRVGPMDDGSPALTPPSSDTETTFFKKPKLGEGTSKKKDIPKGLWQKCDQCDSLLYDRELEDIFALQDEVARQVANALSVTLQPGERDRLAHTPTDNLEAYDLYMQLRMSVWPPVLSNILAARDAYGRVIHM